MSNYIPNLTEKTDILEILHKCTEKNENNSMN